MFNIVGNINTPVGEQKHGVLEFQERYRMHA